MKKASFAEFCFAGSRIAFGAAVVRFVCLVVIILLGSAARPARAQRISVSQGVWLHGTLVTVFDATDDEAPIKLVVNDKELNGVLGPGQHTGIRFGSGLFIFYPQYGYYEAVISAKVCESAPKTNFIVPPPDWAADKNLLGSLALTPEYLETNPRESELRGRVKAINNFLRDHLGRKEMQAELKAWFEQVKRSGIKYSEATCNGPAITGVRVPVYLSDYNNRRTIAVYIRGSRETGYRIEGPQYTAY